MPYAYSRPYDYTFWQIFQALRLFPVLRLFQTLEYTGLVVNPYFLYYFNFEENLNFTELEKYIHQENGTHFIAFSYSL